MPNEQTRIAAVSRRLLRLAGADQLMQQLATQHIDLIETRTDFTPCQKRARRNRIITQLRAAQ